MNEVANAVIDTNAMMTTAAGVNAPSNELFVINLCAAMTPMPSVPKSLKGFEEYKLYQVSRIEDGRRRFRLRLGFFSCEADADLLLSSVRGLYPAAFTGCATSDDLRFNGETAAKSHISLAPAVKLPAVTSGVAAMAKPATIPVTAETTVAAAAPQIIPTAPMPAGDAVKPTAQAALMVDESTQIMKSPARSNSVAKHTQRATDNNLANGDELSLEFMPTVEPGVPAAADDVSTADNKPFHVGRGITLPDTGLDFAPEPARAATPAAITPPATSPAGRKAAPHTGAATAATAGNKSEPPAAKPAAIAQRSAPPALAQATPVPGTGSAAAPHAASKLPAARIDDDYVPILDTTLTIRTLTQTEVDDPNQPQWFVVQLASSEHPFNLDAMPRLDIFAAYRLYSVVVTEASSIRHNLRLGFFREGVSADAVSGYLKTFFPSPTVTRVGIAEYERFTEPKPRPAAATAEPAADGNKVVKLSDKREPDVAGASSVMTTPAKPVANAAVATARGAGSKKAAQTAVTKGANKAMLSASGIRQAHVARPQSFLSRLIGRDLD